jgi:hypothetical protein
MTDIQELDAPDGNEADRYDDPEPCGESMCHCDHLTQHGPCGCDCPQWYDTPDDDGQDW